MFGTVIVTAVLAIILFFAGRATIREFKRELSGQGCSGCGGNCSKCSSANKAALKAYRKSLKSAKTFGK